MRIPVLVAFLSLLASAAAAATIVVNFTIPAFNNSAVDCAATPILVPASDPVWAVWTIPTLGVRDSTWQARGARVSRTCVGADSTKSYEVNAWLIRQIGSLRIQGCKATTTKQPTAVSGPLPPAAPTLEP